MGWKIPRIRIRVPEVHAPRVKAMPARLPKAPRKTRAGGRLRDFDLTVFSKKGVTHIDVIRELIASGGSRRKAAEKLGVTPRNISYHAKKIRMLTDAQLQNYAKQLNTTVAQIRTVCVAPENITHIDIIRVLIACGGNRTKTAKKLRIVDSAVSYHAKNIRQLPDAKLKEYAERLGTTIEKIRSACADMAPQKGITHIGVIRTLIKTGGDRVQAAKKLGITTSGVRQHIKNIRQTPDAKLQIYATQLNTTIEKIRALCADLSSTKGITHIDVIRELIVSGGNRRQAAKILGIDRSAVSQHAKNIRHMTDAQLQPYAGQLNTTVKQIRFVCADLTRSKKNITHIDAMRALLSAGGNRRQAAKILGIDRRSVSNHAKNIRHMTDAQLQPYAGQLNTTVKQIRFVCADLTPQKGITPIDVIGALLASGGNRTNASKKLEIIKGNVRKHAKNIRQLPDAKLKEYAEQLGTTVEQIREVCADMTPKKGANHIDVIRELLASGGNRTKAAKKLGIGQSVVGRHAKNIRQLSDAQLQIYAGQLGITVVRIREICADTTPKKGITHIDAIRALLASGGNRTKAAGKLGVTQPDIGYHAKNIKQLSIAQLKKYAGQLNTTVARIRTACAVRAPQKGITHIDVIRKLLGSCGNRIGAAGKLGVTPSSIAHHAKNIMQLPYCKLQEYAGKLGVTPERIKEVCAPALKRAKEKLFGK